MYLYARQGDLVIEKLSTPITAKLTAAVDLVLAGSSSGRRHRLRGRQMVLIEERRTLVRVAEPTVLEHDSPTGHKTTPIEPGDYEFRSLRERGDRSDRQVED